MKVDRLSFFIIYFFLVTLILPLKVIESLNIQIIFSAIVIYFFLLVKDKKEGLIYCIYIFGLILFSIIINEYSKIFLFVRELIYILAIVMIFKYDILKNITKKKKLINLLWIISFISLCIQINTYTFIGRRVLSVLDPNGSSQIMLLFLFLSTKLDKKLGIWLSLCCSFLFLSKNFLLSILLFYILRYSKKLYKKILYKYSISIEHIFYVGSIFLTLISYIYIKKNNFETITLEYDFSSERVFKLVDYSNLYRFLFNIEVLKNIYKPKLFFLGAEKLYLKNGVEVFPHNDLYYMIYNFGVVYFILYIKLIFKKIREISIYDNFEYICSYCIFGMFLSAYKNGPLLILFIIILTIPEKLKIKRKLIPSRD